jgi:hypothetical protein
MNDEAVDYRSCAVCGRTILHGESVSSYVAPDGAEAAVCELCKPRAEASDWVPAALAAAGAGPGRARRRRGLGLRERIARVSDAVTARAEGSDRAETNGAVDPPEAPPRRAAPPRPAREEERPHERPVPRRTPSREQAVREALVTFNAAEERRTVAGLLRSLGKPSVSVLPDSDGAAIITVAWELSWYQWRARGGAIEEVAKGSELEELDQHHQEWNGEADEDGSLRLRSTPPSSGGEEQE